MKPIIQEDVTGCGIASVAAMAGITYQQAKKAATRLGIEVTDSRLWSDTAFVRKLLQHYNVKASRQKKPFRSWNTLPPLALLAIKWHRQGKQAFWHWVVFCRNSKGPVVLDPKQNLQKHIRTDFGRIKPRWFITIRPKKLMLK